MQSLSGTLPKKRINTESIDNFNIFGCGLYPYIYICTAINKNKIVFYLY